MLNWRHISCDIRLFFIAVYMSLCCALYVYMIELIDILIFYSELSQWISAVEL